ncbi:MAG: hypothetical protein IKU23_01860 [Clostridia bacterium]|nr:hypothetical protein [Clostridia bacterium]
MNQLIEEFIETLRNTYVEARKAKSFFGVSNESEVLRGGSRSISADTEDMVACLLVRLLEQQGIKDIVVFTNQPVKTSGNPRYPDIVVCRETKRTQLYKKANCPEYECLYMIDVKTDMGWFRNCLQDIIDDHANIDFQSGFVNNGILADGTKRKVYFNTENCKAYDIVILSTGNGGNINHNSQPRCSCFFLTNGEHPNEYKNIDVKEIKPCQFDEFFQRVIACLKGDN